MTNTQEWWERFWSERIPKDVTTNKEPETWYDLVWQVAFDYWYELFEKLAPGKRMLECGCGSARVSQYMAQRGYQCTLLDSSEQALSIARRNFESLSLDGQFILGDMNALCLRDQQFDAGENAGRV